MLQPTSESERYRILDVLRGLALFGVLVMNLMTSFRISLFDYMEGRRLETGFAGPVINGLLEVFAESKAFILFSLLFGVGTAIQAERVIRRGVSARVFLFRRFVFLLLFGAAHILL